MSQIQSDWQIVGAICQDHPSNENECVTFIQLPALAIDITFVKGMLTQEEAEEVIELIASAPDLLSENKELKAKLLEGKRKYDELSATLDDQWKLKRNAESLNAELLEALKECDSLLDRSDVSYFISKAGDMALKSNLIRKVRKAIAKAEQK